MLALRLRSWNTTPNKRKQGLLGQTADSKTCTEMKRAKAILKKKLKDLDYATPRPARVCERCPDTAQASPWNKMAREWVCTAMELHSQQRQHHSEWTEGGFPTGAAPGSHTEKGTVTSNITAGTKLNQRGLHGSGWKGKESFREKRRKTTFSLLGRKQRFIKQAKVLSEC